MALLVACDAFPSESNLCSEGKSLVRRLLMYEIEAGSSAVKAGDGWGGCSVTNPSYMSTGYYAQFGNFVGDSSKWQAVIKKAYEVESP